MWGDDQALAGPDARLFFAEEQACPDKGLAETRVAHRSHSSLGHWEGSSSAGVGSPKPRSQVGQEGIQEA